LFYIAAPLDELRGALGESLVTCIARETELGLAEAVRTYVFNSQLVEHEGGVALLAPREAETGPARAFLDRVPVNAVHFVDVNASMKNGGGPACLRLSVLLTDEERTALGARVLVDDDLDDELVAWVERHYRDRLAQHDLADPALWLEVKQAFDELSQLLELGPIWDFQR
jgi:succinylarginine dihydrolase